MGTICTREHSLRVVVDESGDRLIIADHPGSIEEWRLDGLVDAITGSGGTCLTDGDNASDALRILTIDVPGEGGIAVSPDGQWLAASSGYEGTLTIVDAATGEREFEIHHGTEIGLVGFSPDSRRLAVLVNEVGTSLDSLRVYTLDTDEIVELARAKVTRSLTEAGALPIPRR